MRALRLALALFLLACRGPVSERDIDRWQKSESVAQIAEALAAQKTRPPVRLRAAQALVELAADAHFSAALAKLDKATRAELARDLGPELDRLFASPDLARQVLAKDFLGVLVLAGDQHTLDRAGQALVQWYAQDFRGRISLGKVSAIELLKRIGTPALPALHTLLRPEGELILLAKVIQGIGDRGGIRHAADLIGRVADGQAPHVPQRTLRALFTLGGRRAARLLARIAGTERRYSLRTRRMAAEEMRALAHRASLDVAARMGLDRSEDLYLRESSLVYLEKVCDASCAPYLSGLWPLLRERGLRFEAASAIIKIGGAAVLTRLLRDLPPKDTYGDKGLAGLAEDIRRGVGAAALPALRAALRRAPWPGRILAMRALGHVGAASDAARLEALSGDRTRPKGWKVTTTLGEEAARAARHIRGRGR
jgi:hypothetical protein